MVQEIEALSSLGICQKRRFLGPITDVQRLDSEILVEILSKANCYLLSYVSCICVCSCICTHMGAHEPVCGGHRLKESAFLSYFLLHGSGEKIGSSHWTWSSLIQLDWLTKSQGSFCLKSPVLGSQAHAAGHHFTQTQGNGTLAPFAFKTIALSIEPPCPVPSPTN